jgi:hypothetical protein
MSLKFPPLSYPTTICYNWAILSRRGQCVCREINRQYASLSHVSLLTLSAQNFSFHPTFPSILPCPPPFLPSPCASRVSIFSLLLSIPQTPYLTLSLSAASVLSPLLFLSVLYGNAGPPACPKIRVFLSV